MGRPRWATAAVVAVIVAACVVGCWQVPAGGDALIGEMPHGGVVQTARPGSTVSDTAPRRFTLTMGGDLLWHNTVWQSAAEDHARTGRGDRFDFDPMFAAVRTLFADADVALCHAEVPFAAVGGPLSSYPLFAAPPEIAHWIASMGWDACTTASNHSIDQGLAGLVRTADLLDAAGVAHIGTFRSRGERRAPVILDAGSGVRVGVVAGTYGLNGLTLPAGSEYAVSMLDPEALIAQARRAKRAGADVVIAHLHAGDEYSALPNQQQIDVVRRLTAAREIDLVLGEHAHTVQPITRVNGRWVVYGMGNLVAQQELTRPATYRGIVVRFTFVERRGGGFRVARAEYVPVGWNAYAPGHPIRVRPLDEPADADTRRAVIDAVNGLGRTPGLRVL